MPRTKGQTVEEFLNTLDHPYKPEILALRQIILGTDPAITEEVKWNAPSFRTTEHFATFQLRAKEGVQIIFHLGAKVSAAAAAGITVADPDALLTWLAKDRASVIFHNLGEIQARQTAFCDLVRVWIAQV
jgi:hypothetical protein